jgi:Xaa-Pro aminopeptidase
MAFESQVVSYDTYSWLKKNLKTELIPVKGIVENDRIIKDETELELIRQAAAIGDAVFAEMLSQIRLGMSEKEIADKIDNLLRQKGCEKEAFTTIAVAGENAALPHGTPGDKVIAAGEMITMDYGGFFQGYLADMTRTIGIGEMDSSYHDKYMAVLEAQQLGVSMIKAGIRCKDVDQAVRTRLQSYGLDEYFLHSTGHGVGLEVHEMPAVSSSSDTVVQPGMVITIEPGIYIKGWGGIRIEDTVIVKQDSCEVVTKANKNLILI